MIWTASSAISTRARGDGKSNPYDRYSPSNQPAPYPRISRPPLIQWRLAAIFAISEGCRHELHITIVPRSTLGYCAATQVRWVQHSNRNSSEYARWSEIHTDLHDCAAASIAFLKSDR